MSDKAKQNITGYKYSLSILMGLCRGPIEQIVQIKVGDMVAWTGPLIRGAVQIPIYQPQLFGGDEAEGGVVGGFDFYDGNDGQVLPATTTQIIQSTNEIAVASTDGSTLIPLPATDDDADSSTNDDAPSVGNPTIPILYQQVPVPVPALRGVTTLWFDGQICSNNPYPKTWKVRMRRALEGWDGDPWYPEAAVVPMQDREALATSATDTANVQASASQDEEGNGDYTSNTTPASTAILLPESGAIYAMNGAHILYEVITNRSWGRGLDRTLIDDPSFTAAANWLLQEGFGLCLKWNKTDDMSDFIQHLLDTIGGILFTSRLTGLLTLKLIRNDYNVSQLPTLDYTSGLISVEDASNQAQDSLTNEVIVKYHSPVSDTDRQVRAQNLASITTLDSVYSTTKEYPGIPTPDLAQRVAQRDLAAIAWGVKTYTLSCDRRAYKLQPGDCFVLTAPDRNILNTVLRLLKIEDGTMTDGVLKLTCAQDVYGLPLTTFGQPEPIGYNPPNRNPQPVSYHRLIEATYRDAYLRLSSGSLVDLGPGQTGFTLLPAQPTTLCVGFRMKVSIGGGALVDRGLDAFSLFVRLVSKIGKYDSSLTLAGFPSGFSMALPVCLLIDDEFLRVDSLDSFTGIATVSRGVVDSLPQAHAAGAVAWFYDTGQSDLVEYATGETISVYEQTRTTKGLLPIGDMTGLTTTFVGRQERPFPPANVTVNGPYALDDGGQWNLTAVDLTINFARRNRLTAGDLMVGFNEPDMVPEVGQTTTVRIRRLSDGVVVGTYPNIAGTQFIYTQVQALADGAFGLLNVELYSVNAAGTPSKYVYVYPLNYFPAAAVVTPPGGVAPRVGIQQCTLFLTSVHESAAALALGTMASTITISKGDQAGSIPNTGSSTAGLAFTAPDQHGSTLGGFALTATIVLKSDLSGSAPAIGQGFGSFTLQGILGKEAAGMVSSFVLTSRLFAKTAVLPGMNSTLALTAVQAGSVISIDNGQESGNFALTAVQTATTSPIATGTMSSGFSFRASQETGQDIASGTSTATVRLTATEAGKLTATGSSTAAMRFTGIQASSQIADCRQTAALALTTSSTATVTVTGSSTGNAALTAIEAASAPATGSSTATARFTAAQTATAAATGTSTGNLALTSADAGTVAATGTTAGNLAFTSVQAGTVAAAGGYAKSYGTKYGS